MRSINKRYFPFVACWVKSYHSIASKLFVLLSNQPPTPAQVDHFAQEIVSLVKESKKKSITHKALLQAYIKVTNANLTLEEQADLHKKLEESQIKDEISNVLITPEEIVASIGQLVPQLDSQLQKDFAHELQGLLHENPVVYQNGADFARVPM